MTAPGIQRLAVRLLFLFGTLAWTLPSVGQSNLQGQWTTLPTLMPINPVHVALMRNGKVLVVSGSGNDPLNSNLQAGVWDPSTGTITTQSIAWDMFCNGMVVLPDGRPFILGGTLQYDPFYGQRRTAVFDPITNIFTNTQIMAHGRWYPTPTVLGDGRVMIFSGLDNLTGATNKTVEIYNTSTGWGSEITATWTPPLYPRMHLLPNGKVFYSGPDSTTRSFDPATGLWTTVAATKSGIYRNYGTSVLLPLNPGNGYAPKVMIFGGGSPATPSTEIIDLSAPSPAWNWGPNMSQARIEMSGVILPNGKILTLGGSVNDEDLNTASLNADLYDPTSNTMSSAGANAYPRLYHSVALLLPDATVWVAGGNPTRGSYETNVEIYQPSYLFTTDGSGNPIPAARPTISVAASEIAYGNAFNVQTPDAASIAQVVLVRPGSPTHAFDQEQRLVGMNFTVGSGSLTVTAPPNGNTAPPGYYMLFLLNTSGVPSVAKFVHLTQTAGPDFTMGVNPASQTVTPGAGTTYNIAAAANGGFSGNISLSVSGLPSGASASFNPTSIPTSGSSVMSVSTSALTPGGNSTLTITGTSGSLVHSVPASLVVALPTAATPTFSPAPGTYSTSQSVTLSDTTPSATIYYTTDGSAPTTSSTVYSTPIPVTIGATIKAMAAAPGFSNSGVATGSYIISSGTPTVNFSNGFNSLGMAFNGSAALSGTRLRLTDGGTNEASSAFYTTQLNLQTFTSDFSFQLISPSADGFAFVIQRAGTTALGPGGGGLGYGPSSPGGTPGIPTSIAIKFDLYDNNGEGINSTGLYTNGASPTTPAVVLGGGVDLHSGDVFNVHLTYDSTTLTMTITDATTPSKTFTTSWVVNLPTTIGGNTAYAGFSGGTGGMSAVQDVISWTYTTTVLPSAATPTFSPAPGTYTSAQSVSLSDTTSGATIYYTTDGSTPTTSSAVYSNPISVSATTTIKAMAAAAGLNNSTVTTGTYTISGTPPPPAVTFVQAATGPSTIQGSNSQVSVTFLSPQAAGHLNIVVAGWGDTTSNVTSVTDTLGNTYSLAVGPTTSTNLKQVMYYAKNVAGGNNTVTVRFNQAASYPDIRILEYAGADTINPLDAKAAATGSGITANSGTAATTSPNELIFGSGTTENVFTAAGTGFVSRMINIYGNIAEDKSVTATGNYNATATGNSAGWVMQMATFRAAGPSAPAPTVSSVSPSSGTTAGGTAVTVTGTGFLSGATVSIGGTAATNVIVVGATSITATAPAHAAGAVNVVVTNTDAQSGTLTSGYTYTNPAPTVTGISPNSGTTAGNTSVTITGTGFLNGATVSIGGAAATNVVVATSTSITAKTPAHAAGATNVVVTNTDTQSGTLSGGYTFTTPNPGPTVTSISPSSGTTAGGTAVTITGTGFLSGAAVSIGGTAATNVVVVGATSITATAPAHAAGAVNVVVTNTDAQSGTLTSGYTYTNPAPTVTGISPNSGTTAGNTSVTITGTGFLNGATVSIGGAAATNVVVATSTSITAKTPAHVAGATDVVVTNTDTQSGTLSGGYTFNTPNPAPTVTSISPSSGTTAGGTAVTVTGTGFLSGATVSIGGTVATNVVVVGATSITATAPAHAAGAVNVVVTNTDAQSGTLTSGYTYTNPAPTVTGISPNSGTTAGNTSVTITGTGFLTGATVSIGGAAATNVVVATSTSITAKTPAHVAGIVDVVVTNSDGKSGMASGAFTYQSATSGISFVQVNGAPTSNQPSLALLSVAYPTAQIAGHLNIVVIGWGDNAANITSVTDTLGNIYNLAIGPNSSPGLQQSIYYAKNIAGGNNTVTVQFDRLASFPDIRVLEYAGADPVNPLDVKRATSGTGATANSGSVTTTSSNELIFGAGITGTRFSNPGSGFVSRLINFYGNIVEDRNVTAIGSYSATAKTNSTNWVMQIVTFK